MDEPDDDPIKMAVVHDDEPWPYTDGEPIPMVDAEGSEKPCPTCEGRGWFYGIRIGEILTPCPTCDGEGGRNSLGS